MGNQAVTGLKEDPPAPKVVRTEDEWRAVLTPETFRVARMHGTEPAWSGKYNECKDTGTYTCACCGHELFTSRSKFDSGSGWPSFFQPAADAAIRHQTDRSGGMIRTEVLCKNCDAHLGHVFSDGPAPTGLRYCINSCSLELRPSDAADEPMPDAAPEVKAPVLKASFIPRGGS